MRNAPVQKETQQQKYYYPCLVQTVGFETGRKYDSFMDTWTHLCPPPNHVNLLTLRQLSIHGYTTGVRVDFIELYADGQGTEHRVWKRSGFSPPPSRVLHARHLHVHFYSDENVEYMGFLLVYSYHPESCAPSRVPGGLWNCSVPEWPHFERHFRCNLKRECEGGEDEVTCPYFGFCGEDYLTVDNRCYMYLRTNTSLSWLDANQECGVKGGHLASLNTAREWTQVFDLLKSRPVLGHVLIGLRAFHSSLPF
ncbi:hypothetical protein ACOMHN_060687 [Nucella lapillus]